MSKLIDSVSAFAGTCLQLFPPFRQWSPDQERTWSDIMARELHGFSPEVLDRAFTELVRSRKSAASKDRSTPTPGECAAFCAEAKRWIEAKALKDQLPGLGEENGKGGSKVSEEFALSLMRNPLGREAVRDGWALACRDFILREGHAPSGQRYVPRNAKERDEYAGCSEIEFCKRSARGFGEAYDHVLRGGGGVYAPVLEKLGDSIRNKERAIEEALGR